METVDDGPSYCRNTARLDGDVRPRAVRMP